MEALYRGPLLDFQQLDVKDERRVRRNARELGLPVGEVRRADKPALTADLHTLDALIPA